MHTKTKGSIGEISVIRDLYRRGFAVFTEFGDNCKTDLIAMTSDNFPVRIQVKASMAYDKDHKPDNDSDASVTVYRNSSGPGYRYSYGEDDFDVLAAYILDRDEILYIPITELTKVASSMSFRFKDHPPANGQTKGIRWADDYHDFISAVRAATKNLPI